MVIFMKSGVFTILQWDDADCFLQTSAKHPAVLPLKAIPLEIRKHLKERRQLEIIRENDRDGFVCYLTAGIYTIANVDTVKATLLEFENEAVLGWEWKEYVIESESEGTILPEYNIPHALRPYLKNGRKVEIGEDGSITIPGLSARKPAIYTVMSWSGHDGLLETPKGDFALVYLRKLSPELHGYLAPGRQVEINVAGIVVRTREDTGARATEIGRRQSASCCTPMFDGPHSGCLRGRGLEPHVSQHGDFRRPICGRECLLWFKR
jgi:hypothetical protein